MKLTPDIIRTLIKEEIESLCEFQPGEQTFTDPITRQSVEIPVNTLARGLAASCKNIDHALDAVVRTAQQIMDDRQEQEKEDQDAAQKTNTLGFGTSSPNRKDEEWTDADHARQEEFAQEIENKNPGIPKPEKMAYAGAQVNREKRKRARKKKK